MTLKGYATAAATMLAGVWVASKIAESDTLQKQETRALASGAALAGALSTKGYVRGSLTAVAAAFAPDALGWLKAKFEGFGKNGGSSSGGGTNAGRLQAQSAVYRGRRF